MSMTRRERYLMSLPENQGLSLIQVKRCQGILARAAARRGELGEPHGLGMSTAGLTRRERYQLRTMGFGIGGAIGHGLLGAVTGAGIGAVGGPAGMIGGAAIGGLTGAITGHISQEHQRRVAKAASEHHMRTRKYDEASAKARAVKDDDFENAPKTREGHAAKAAMHRVQESEAARNLTNTADTNTMRRIGHAEAMSKARQAAEHHEGIAANWDESKHPRDDQGEFT